MPAYLFILLFTLVAGAPALAAPRCDAILVPDEAEIAVSHAYLWKVERDGKTAYALGTIHAGVQLGDLPDWFHREILAKSRTLVLEANPRLQLTPDHPRARLPGDVTLSSLIGPKAADEVVRRLPEMARSEIERIKPFYLALLLKTQPRRSFVPGIDFDLHKHWTRTSRDRVRYLEDVEFLMSHLDQELDPASLLKELERTPAEALAEMERQIVDYASGTYRLDPRYAPTEFGGKLVYRHVDWIDGIERLLDTENDVLLAVGLNHLLSKNSVLDLLAKRGFKITRVNR